jgi:hypothetical protein
MDPIIAKFRDIVAKAYTVLNENKTIVESDQYLVPAVKQKSTGKIFRGEVGQYHHDIAEKNGFFRVDWKKNPDLEFGFVNQKGHFLDRKRALDYAIEHDLLHDAAKKYLALPDAPAELGASFLKKPE